MSTATLMQAMALPSLIASKVEKDRETTQTEIQTWLQEIKRIDYLLELGEIQRARQILGHLRDKLSVKT